MSSNHTLIDVFELLVSINMVAVFREPSASLCAI
jgi:hypothetical protein